MNKILCFLVGHNKETHLDYIWGNLPREHQQCSRCGKTLLFERPREGREELLFKIGDIRDGDVRGCRSLSL